MIGLYNGDAIQVMKSNIKDASVDLVLTDPPYNISKPNNFKSLGRAGIDFGEWDKGFDLFSYIDEVARILKPNGSFVVFNAWRNLGAISDYAETKGFITKDLFRLEKSNPMPRNRDRRYISDYEFAIWFTVDGGKWTFNRTSPTYERPKYVGAIESGLHPTQKNLGLMEHLVKIHSNEGDLVVDPFSGSFTTGLACKNLNRLFIGIEANIDYYNIGINRLKSV
jgi:DNA modification methylase